MSPGSPRRRIIVSGTEVSHAPMPEPTTGPARPTGPASPVAPPAPTAPAPAAPSMDPAQLHRLREQATAQTARILSRATAIRERIGAARKSDLADLDAAAAALHEGIEEQRRLRRDRAVAGAERERAEARAALERTVSELAPGAAGSDLRTIDADAVGRPSRWTRIGAFRAPDELGGAPALAPLICASHWRVEGSTRRAQDLVLATLARLVTQIPLPHLRLLVFDPRVTGVLGAFAPLRETVGSAFPPPFSEAGAFADAVRTAMADAASNAERIAVGGARDLLDLWRRDGEPTGSLTVVVVLDHPYGVDEQLGRLLDRVADMSPGTGIHLMIQHDPALGGAPGARRGTLVLRHDAGTWAVPNLPAGAVVESDDPPSLAVLDAAVRAARQAATKTTGPVIPLADLIGEDLGSPWSGSSIESLDAAIGRAGRDPLTLSLRSENPPHPNVLIGGAVGQGKSNLLLDIIYSLAARYSPDELSMLLLDYKQGLEFHRFAPDAEGRGWLPHVKVLSLESDQEFGVAVLRHVTEELERRSRLFKEAGAPSIGAYRRATGLAVPRMLVIIDEFHALFEGDDDLVDQAVSLLEAIAKQGRAYGIHLLLASQTISGISGLRAKGDSIFAQFPLRMSLKNTAQESEAILSPHNRAAAELTYRGEVILNRNYGLDPAAANVRGVAAWAEPQTLDELQRRLFDLGHTDPPMVFIGANRAAWPEHGPDRADDGEGPAMWLGRPVRVTQTPVSLTLDADVDQGVVLVGSGDDLADGALSSMTLTALRTMDPACELVVLNGMKELPPGLARVVGARSRSGRAVRVVPREEVAAFLVRDVTAALDDGAEHPMLLVGVGLQRVVGMDRPLPDDAAPAPGAEPADDDLGFSDLLAAGPAQTTPAQVLQRVFERGALQGVFAVGWWSSRRAMERDLGSYNLPGVRALVLLKLGLVDLRDLAGPHTKPFGRGPRIGLLDHTDDAGLRVLVPFEIPDDDVLEETW